MDEHGYMVMLALLDVVDDTRLVKKVRVLIPHCSDIIVIARQV